jgi:hypothetical protein
MPKVPVNALTGPIVGLVVGDEVLVRTLAVEFFAEGVRRCGGAGCRHRHPHLADRGGARPRTLYRRQNARPNGWLDASAPCAPQLALD